MSANTKRTTEITSIEDIRAIVAAADRLAHDSKNAFVRDAGALIRDMAHDALRQVDVEESSIHIRADLAQPEGRQPSGQ